MDNPLLPLPFKDGQPIAQLELGTQRNFTYLLMDWDSKMAAVIDPQKNTIDDPKCGIEPILAPLRASGFTLKYCLLTHAHPDHTVGVPDLSKEAVSGKTSSITLVAHALEKPRLESILNKSSKSLRTKFIQGGETLTLGKMKIECLHTPGHTDGGLTFILSRENAIFTGDFLFIRDCGRTDLPSGSNEQMFESLQKIKELNPALRLFPGHHYAKECFSTLKRELETSPPLKCKNIEALTQLP